jgi:uncharacterized RDD family membrane protein YckC
MPIDIENTHTPALWRRLAAMVYDGLLLLALLILAAAVAVLVLGLGLGIPTPTLSAHPLFRLYLLAVILAFFCGFWLHGGQTLGMRAWRVRVVRDDGAPLTLGRALLRLAAATLSWAALGIGFLWSLIDPDRLTWHDRLTHTRLVMVEKPKR